MPSFPYYNTQSGWTIKTCQTKTPGPVIQWSRISEEKISEIESRINSSNNPQDPFQTDQEDIH